MLMPLLSAGIGALLGAWQARRRQGSGGDVAQWAAVWALIGFLIGFLALVIYSRAVQ
ncbi:hypothetical protein JQC91_00155 [Jannaschia sp. Os4]|uniref:hypothetical protein n=1 Tax=Jannaschia sp. Os4 TaxID=2807617 RepID=UPI00193AD89D|nr:hypothetical protein [Jannaschia sp. Os4]MBM2574701.1 hypothetical protein [Jannaschia sp. Os4]